MPLLSPSISGPAQSPIPKQPFSADFHCPHLCHNPTSLHPKFHLKGASSCLEPQFSPSRSTPCWLSRDTTRFTTLLFSHWNSQLGYLSMMYSRAWLQQTRIFLSPALGALSPQRRSPHSLISYWPRHPALPALWHPVLLPLFWRSISQNCSGSPLITIHWDLLHTGWTTISREGSKIFHILTDNLFPIFCEVESVICSKTHEGTQIRNSNQNYFSSRGSTWLLSSWSDPALSGGARFSLVSEGLIVLLWLIWAPPPCPNTLIRNFFPTNHL